MGLRVLYQTNFRRFFIGYTTSLFGTGMAPVAIAFAVLDTGGSASDLGFVLAAGVLAQLTTLLAGGVLADRLDRRVVMLVSDSVRCVSQGAFAAIVLAGHPPIWALASLSAVGGAATGIFNPGLVALTTEVVDVDGLHEANVLIGMAKNLGMLAGPATAGALIAFTSAGTVIAIDAGTYAVSVVSLALLRLDAVSSHDGDRAIAGLRAGWTAWSSRSWMWITNLRTAVFNLLVYAPLLVLGPVIAKRHLGGAAAWGLILAAYGAGAVLAGLGLIGRRPAHPLVVGHLGQAAWALPLVGLALVLPAPAIAASAFLAGVGNATFVALWLTTMQREVASDVLARVSSYDFLVGYALWPVGDALAAPIASVVGRATVLWIGAGWQVLSTAVAVALPAIRNVTQPAITQQEH